MGEHIFTGAQLCNRIWAVDNDLYVTKNLFGTEFKAGKQKDKVWERRGEERTKMSVML